ncbi:MAG: sigma 54-interacting transcriptional regulator [Bryobacteraceae bacterium]|nr:sigma 54-interacting transcriptional regulator [Bryobacteraceae bacterium]
MLSPSAAARYQTLLEVTESIVSQQQFHELLGQLREAMGRIVAFHGMSITLYDPRTQTIRLLAINAAKETPVKAGLILPVNRTPAAVVIETGQPYYARDIALEDSSAFAPEIQRMLRDAGVRSFAIFPLSTARNRILGTLNFGALQPSAYSDEDLAFLAQAARPVAIAVENAMHHDAMLSYQAQLATERDHLRLLLDINNAVVTHLDTPSLIATVSECLRKHFRLDDVAIEIPAGSAASRKPQIRNGNQCVVPLVFRDRALGTLSLTSPAPEETFSEAHIQLLSEVAGQIAIALDNALSYRQIAELNARLAEEKLYLQDEIRSQFGFEEIIGRSPALLSVLRQVETVAPSDSAVVICGETGTGKELIARAIHDLSERRNRTFVKINCAAIPGGLLESELFGHERGAFTGAIARRIGRFELAHGGTLFLDEIGEIPLDLQPKLLRVLQEREFERLGSSHTMKVDVRVVAATNRDLMQMVRERRFRDDLYYRLNVFPLFVPPLRDRRDDIPILVRHFVQLHARRMRREITSISAESLDLLTRYDWPGNVRELQNLIERAVIVTQGSVLQIPAGELRQPLSASADEGTLKKAERDHILHALEATKWVLAGPFGAAARLGLKRSTLQFRMKKLGIERPGHPG